MQEQEPTEENTKLARICPKGPLPLLSLRLGLGGVCQEQAKDEPRADDEERTKKKVLSPVSVALGASEARSLLSAPLARLWAWASLLPLLDRAKLKDTLF